MAIKTVVNFDGTEYQVLEHSLQLSRGHAPNGQAVTDVNAGLMYFKLVAGSDQAIWDKHVDSHAKVDSIQVDFYKANEEAISFSIIGQECYVQSYGESQSYKDQEQGTLEVMFAYTKLDYDGAVLHVGAHWDDEYTA